MQNKQIIYDYFHITPNCRRIFDAYEECGNYNLAAKFLGLTRQRVSYVCGKIIKLSENTDGKYIQRFGKSPKYFDENLDLKTVKINETGLSKRAKNSLSRAGFETVSDIKSITKTELLALKGISLKTANEIFSELKKFKIVPNYGDMVGSLMRKHNLTKTDIEEALKHVQI